MLITNVPGTQKSQTLKWLFKRLVSMANNVEEASHVDALILLSTEFGVDCSSVLEKLKEIRGTQDAVNNSDTTIASTASKAPRRKKVSFKKILTSSPLFRLEGYCTMNEKSIVAGVERDNFYRSKNLRNTNASSQTTCCARY